MMLLDVILSLIYPPYSLEVASSLNLKLMEFCLAWWLVNSNNSPASTSLLPLRAGIIHMCSALPDFLYEFCRFDLRALCFQGKLDLPTEPPFSPSNVGFSEY